MAEASIPKIELPLKPSVETLQQQIDSMKEAVKLLQEGVNRMPTSDIVDGKVDALKELTDTKIDGLKELVNTRLEGNKIALDAALTTQKEGSDKIERNFTEQFRNIVANISTLTKAFDDKINDLKDRFNTSEGRSKGLGDGWGILLGVASLIVAAVIVIGFIIAK